MATREQLLEQLNTLTDDELNEVRERISEIRRVRKLLKLKERIASDIRDNGFFIDVSDETKKFGRVGAGVGTDEFLKSNVTITYSIYSYDKCNRSDDIDDDDIEIDNLVDTDADNSDEIRSVNEWFRFHESGSLPELYGKLSRVSFDYSKICLDQYDDWDDPVRGTVLIEIPIFFLPQPFPPPGKYHLLNFSDEEACIITCHPDGSIESEDPEFGHGIVPKVWKDLSQNCVYVPYDKVE